MRHLQSARLAATATICLVMVAACGREQPVPRNLTPGVVLQRAGMPARLEATAAAVDAAADHVMQQSGLVGARGGAHVRMSQAGTHEVILPMPQLVDGQIPLTYDIRCQPADALVDLRLRQFDDAQVVVSLQLKGRRNQEIEIDWSAVILMHGEAVTGNQTRPETYLAATGCVQSEGQPIAALAGQLWPDSGTVSDYAHNIQTYIQGMTQVDRPSRLDAEGILASGANGICTANASLAAALLRAKQIPARSMAVIPPNSMRLEMHRVVEYYDKGRWQSFDPSLLTADIPLQPWHHVIMSKTTLEDEELAMKPRMGAMLGCPYAQELEVLTAGISPWGQEFFWTSAKPLVEFQADAEAVQLAAAAWRRFLTTGVPAPGAIQAASAKNASEFLEGMRQTVAREENRHGTPAVN